MKNNENFLESNLTAKEYLSHITELMDNPVPYTVRTMREDMVIATFIVNDIDYKFIINDKHEVFFQIDDLDASMAITGTGGQFQVFATVASILEEYIQKFKPLQFFFEAKESSRVRLYNTFAKMLKRKFPMYDLWINSPSESDSGNTGFIFDKKW